MLSHPNLYKYQDAISELLKAAERVDDYRELSYWVRVVKQMTPPRLCQCETKNATQTRG